MDRGKNLIWQDGQPYHFAVAVSPQTNRFAMALMAGLDFNP
jgi:hypothetical protein